MVQHRAVEQVFQAGLEVAVEKGELQHIVGRGAVHIGVALQHDLVLRQRAGLVGAQHVHGAKVLDGVQALDHHLVARQHHRAFGQGRGDDHRQHFGRQSHRHRQRKQKRFAPVALGVAVQEEDDRHHDHRKTDQQPADAVDAGLERRGCTVHRGDARGDGAEIGVVAGGQHQRRGRTRDHVGAHEQQVGSVQHAVAGVGLGVGGGEFLDWQRLAGHGSLAEEQVLGSQHTAVGRNHVAGRQHDHIAGHQFGNRQLDFGAGAGAVLALAQHRGGVADHFLQPLGFAVRAAFLHKAQQRRQHHHGADHHGGLVVVRQPGDDGQRRQQQVERVVVRLPQVLPGGHGLFMLDLVRAHAVADAFGFGFAQTARLAVGTRQHRCGITLAGLAQRPCQVRRHRHGLVLPVERLRHQAPPERPQHTAAAREQGEAMFVGFGGHLFSPEQGRRALGCGRAGRWPRWPSAAIGQAKPGLAKSSLAPQAKKYPGFKPCMARARASAGMQKTRENHRNKPSTVPRETGQSGGQTHCRGAPDVTQANGAHRAGACLKGMDHCCIAAFFENGAQGRCGKCY